MAHPIIMPKAGQSMTEGKIVSWLKREGEAVQKGEPILEIETDKANVEVEAQENGLLRKVLAAEGEIRPVLTLIGVIGGAEEPIDLASLEKEVSAAAEAAASMESGDLDAVAAAPEAPQGPPAPQGSAAAGPGPSLEPRALAAVPASTPRPAGATFAAPPAMASAVAVGAPHAVPGLPPPGSGGRVFASPLARRLAKDRGLDLRLVRGTGPGGRILRRDVETAPAQAPAGGDGHAFLRAPSRPYPPPSPRPPAKVAVEGMRKAIGTALQQSKQTIPHFYVTVSVDVTALLELKRAHEAAGTKLSVNDFVVRACAIALQDEPRVNCRVFPDRIEYPSDCNVGIAVGQEFGLVVPVVTKAQDRDVASLSVEIKRIVSAANSGKLIGAGQGTFTVSNLGMYGVESFSAIINPPEGAIVAVGTVTTEVRPWFGGFLPRSILRLTLSSDHRAVDGVLAARFLARVKHLLENPDRL